jgi:hypothetical protein
LCVEDALALGVSDLRRAGLFDRPLGTPCNVTWSDPKNGQQLFRVDFSLTMGRDRSLSLDLRYEVTDPETKKRGLILRSIPVVKAPCPFGGSCHLLVCPCLKHGGFFCRNRVRKLFLPPGAHRWGCRECYNLTYRSAKTHDSRVDRLAEDRAAVLAALQSGNLSQLVLAARANNLLLKRLRRGSGRFFHLALETAALNCVQDSDAERIPGARKA